MSMWPPSLRQLGLFTLSLKEVVLILHRCRHPSISIVRFNVASNGSIRSTSSSKHRWCFFCTHCSTKPNVTVSGVASWCSKPALKGQGKRGFSHLKSWLVTQWCDFKWERISINFELIIIRFIYLIGWKLSTAD